MLAWVISKIDHDSAECTSKLKIKHSNTNGEQKINNVVECILYLNLQKVTRSGDTAVSLCYSTMLKSFGDTAVSFCYYVGYSGTQFSHILGGNIHLETKPQQF